MTALTRSSETDVERSKNYANLPKFMSIKEWSAIVGYIPEGGVRHLIFTNPDFNKKVVRRLGKKVLLDVQAFDNWVQEQRG